MAERGRLTSAIKQKMEAFLGRPTSVVELRLYPYIQYQMMNEQRIDPRKINAEERVVLSKLRNSGFIAGGASGLSISRDFWDFINDILFDAYVAFEDEEPQQFVIKSSIPLIDADGDLVTVIKDGESHVD